MSAKRNTAEDRLPGDLTHDQLVDRIIRVDQAGEYGAKQIYAGQLAVLGHLPVADSIRHMAAQEQDHLERFSNLMTERHVRPTVLQPFWQVAGFALGAATALMSEKAAMACTAAIEEVIDDHYARQSAQLGDDEKPLRDLIDDARADEVAHREEALACGAEEAPAYALLSETIKRACRTAIWLSERI